MTRNGHVRFGERSRETRSLRNEKVRSAPTLFSPLLMNIALHGMEEDVRGIYRAKRQNPLFVRYADDLVVFHPSKEGVHKAQEVIEAWLREMGLELKPSKTNITHTAEGFDFLGFTIRQVRVGKTHRGKRSNGKRLDFKTIIKPSKEALKCHQEEIRAIVEKNRSAPQEKLIKELNPVIRGWTNYYRTVAASQTFSSCRMQLFRKLEYWAKTQTPKQRDALEYEQVLARRGRKRLAFPNERRPQASATHRYQNPTAHQSEGKCKSLRWEAALLESKTLIWSSGKRKGCHSFKETAGKMQMV
jgi:Group II intron, maturase-specific domain/Reverse transcriptase (RNA-dependent DNA polymerase)